MDAKEITVIENSGSIIPVDDYKKKAIEYLSSMGNKLPSKHQTQFIELAQAYGLNPFKREIYAVGYGDNWNIITGYEVYLKRAERIGKLDGWKATIAGSGETMTATVTIYRKDWKMPFEHIVYFTECCQKTKDKQTGKDKLNSVWAKMPSFMLRKVAIAQAFRLCFPDEFGGMPYTADEMPEPTEKNITPSENIADAAIEVAKPVEKKYTVEQANELGELLHKTLSNGNPIFKKEEIDAARNMLINGDFENAKNIALKVIDERIASDIETEIA